MRWLEYETLIHIGNRRQVCMQRSREKLPTFRPRRRRRGLVLTSWRALALGPAPLPETPYPPGDQAVIFLLRSVPRTMKMATRVDATLAGERIRGRLWETMYLTINRRTL